ncbi:hypothetical protein CU103_25605 [Phyllobacterium sophorae]|uniref:Uncharacterized protein n=1 Tax=Phyllobacterium sophorae TaxID=1520277 RepID=A0A2P7B3B8_9HYPH|nr:hypothetical protein CU103_25605 [Phyllobacterium sophorae]
MAMGAGRKPIYVQALGYGVVVSGRGNRQELADRLDPEHLTIFIDERNHRFNGRSSSAWAK